MQGVRVGFIGAGGNARLRHLPGFGQIDGVELTAVANRSLESSQRIANDFGIDRVCADWREIVSAPDIDAVCIGTWPNTHAEMTCAALAAGKHVLVEARMAKTLAEAKTMLTAAAAQPELVAQIVPSPITLEADAIIRDLIEADELGELMRIRSDHATGATLDPNALLSWRMDERVSGINTMALGICYEPMLRWLPGDASVAAAEAIVVTPSRRDQNGLAHQIKIPEKLTVAGRWGNADLEMKQSSVEPGPGCCVYEIVGSKASLRYDVNARSLVLTTTSGGNVQPLKLPKLTKGGWQVEEQFIASIRLGAAVKLTDFKTGLHYMEFTDAVWRAWAE